MAEAATIASALIAQLLSKNNAEHGMCAVAAAGPKHKCVSGKDGFVSVDHAHRDDLLTQTGPGGRVGKTPYSGFFCLITRVTPPD